MRLLSEFGLGGTVVAEFENGIAYHFINGTSINIGEAMSEEFNLFEEYTGGLRLPVSVLPS